MRISKSISLTEEMFYGVEKRIKVLGLNWSEYIQQLITDDCGDVSDTTRKELARKLYKLNETKKQTNRKIREIQKELNDK